MAALAFPNRLSFGFSTPQGMLIRNQRMTETAMMMVAALRTKTELRSHMWIRMPFSVGRR